MQVLVSYVQIFALGQIFLLGNNENSQSIES